MQKFCYLGSTLSSDVNIDNDISSRLVKASDSFGRLSRRLWDDHGIRLHTKLAVYKAVILTAFFYGSETWVLGGFRRHVRKIEQFHMRCLADVRWQEKKSNTEVLQICNITGIEAFLITAQLRCSGHVLRMGDNRLPKVIFCSELEEGTRSHGGQRYRYKDTLKANLKRCDIAPPELEELYIVLDRSDCMAIALQDLCQQFEASRVRTLETKREHRKTGTFLNAASFPCDVCGRSCASRIGLYARRCTHLPTRVYRDPRSVVSTAQSTTTTYHFDSALQPINAHLHRPVVCKQKETVLTGTATVHPGVWWSQC